MPEKVKKEFGDLLTVLQLGQLVAPPHAKPMGGYEPAVIELIEDHNRGTYRVVATVHLEDAIYVLHAFQKKATQGIATSKKDLDLIARRLKEAVEDHEARRERHRREEGGSIVSIEESKGSVFADLFDDPVEAAELALKAQLGARIREVMEERKLRQAEAAKLTGLTQPNISRIVNYKFHEISVERLFRALLRLGVDVRIALPAHEGSALGTLEVVA